VNSIDTELESRLAAIRADGLWRELRRIYSAQSRLLDYKGGVLLNFSSNDYLGLASHPALKDAAVDAVQRFGAGTGASRLISGSLAPHHELEETIAEFKQTPAALSFSSGYAAATGAIGALLDEDDVIILDKLVHASIVDAARLCGATLRVFRHNHLDQLQHLLEWAAKRPLKKAGSARKPRTLVVTESVFSMDGDQAPLPGIVELKNRYGAWLMVDEAHATGLYGKHRRGLAEELGVADQIEVQMGTLGKSFGASGGYICGSPQLVDYLINRARPFIFSTAPVPAAAAAATAGIRLVSSATGEQLRSALWERVADLERAVERASTGHRSAIIPIMVGAETKATALAQALLREDLLVPAIRYPTVARGTARLRVTLTATHTEVDVQRLAGALRRLNPAPEQ
jgi:8-amino-7-oxononanoate synthase